MSLVRNVIIPLSDFVTRNPIRKYIRELEKSQWLSPKSIQKIQEQKLKSLILYAYQNVPYYHKMFRMNDLKPADVKSAEDLVKLPILNREIVRDEFDSKAIISQSYPRKKMHFGCTGGSTGDPIRFFTTRENRFWSVAARYLAWSWAGFGIGDKYAQVFGLHLDRPMFQSLKGKLEGIILRRMSLDAYQTSEKTMEKFVQKMRREKPKILYGTATSVAHLANYIHDKGIGEFCLTSVIIDSMNLFPDEVEMIERVFCCKVWWNYHNRENGTFGSECSEHNGYHLFSPNFVFEFIKEGKKVAPGEMGSIIVTDLTNYAMPFIRYEIGDLGVPSDDICVCGRGLPLMRKLVGRTKEILVSATKEFITDPFTGRLETILRTIDIKQYQIVQETPTRVIVKIVPGKTYTSKDSETIKRMMHSIMGNLKIEVNLEESIHESRSGKREVVIRKFPIKFA